MKQIVFFLIVLGWLVWVEDISAQAGWIFKTPMPTARAGICAAVLDGKVYVMGGRSSSGQVLDLVERYDPQNDRWESSPRLRDGRENAAAVVYDGTIFVLGGRDHEGEVIKKVEFFNHNRNEWEGFDDMLEKREGLGAVVVNGLLYAVGGGDEHEVLLDGVEFFDPSQRKWIKANDWQLILPAASLVAVAVRDSAFTIGGFGGVLGPLNIVQRYYAGLETAVRASLLIGRGGSAVVARGDSIFVLGGSGLLGTLNSVEVFIPKFNRWESFSSLQTARENFAAVAVDHTLFVFGGRGANGHALNSVEAYELVTAVEDEPPILPLGFALEQNYPNPFNAGTKIVFRVPASNSTAAIRLEIFNVRGARVATLVDGPRLPGEYEVFWDGADFQKRPVASGIYVYILEMGGQRIAKKMILSR